MIACAARDLRCYLRVGVLAVQEGEASVHITDSSVHGTHMGSTGFGHGAAAGPHTSLTIEETLLSSTACRHREKIETCGRF